MSHIVHNLGELHALLVQALAGRRDLKAKRARRESGEVWEFLCPRPDHDDSNASAFLGEHGGRCSGCGSEWNLMDLAGILSLDVEWAGSGSYTLDDYAREKGLDPDLLRLYGCTTEPNPWRPGAEALMIPYRDFSQRLVRRRVRVWAPPKKGNKFWEPPSGGAIPGLYGEWMLASPGAAGQPVLLVEGESDCHACWHARILALGLPGADTWKPEWAALLAGREVYVWKEPDQGGATMLRGVAASFPEARVIEPPPGIKDPCQLRQRDPEAFPATMAALMKKANPIGVPDPPIRFAPVAGDSLERMKQDRLAPLDVIPTPYRVWNEACRGRGGRAGVARGWYIILGGRQGGYKTMLAQYLAVAGLHAGERAAIMSLEMSYDENAVRVLGMTSQVPVRELEHGHGFVPESWDKAVRITEARMQDMGGAIYVNEEPISRLSEIEASMEHYARYESVRMFVVDYLQLAWVKEAGDRVHEQVLETSKVLRRFAKATGSTVIAISQITNEAAKEARTPIAQHLYGGMPLAADADQVVLLDHSRMRRLKETMVLGGQAVQVDSGIIETVLVLDKNRHGPSKVEIPVTFDPSTLCITERRLAEGQEW